MDRKIYIIDFDDSFTFNIASTYHQLGEEPLVINHREIENEMDQLLDGKRKIIVWGPGPKRPSDYSHVFRHLIHLRKRDEIFHVGICLGHQILMTLDGFELVTAHQIIHGQAIKVFIPEWNHRFDPQYHNQEVAVQRYNSLAIKYKKLNSGDVYQQDGEVIMYSFKNGISYQFHPESVGTSFPSLFFDSSIKFLYNSMDEQITQTSRNIQSGLNSTRC